MNCSVPEPEGAGTLRFLYFLPQKEATDARNAAETVCFPLTSA